LGNKINGVLLYLVCGTAMAADVDVFIGSSRDESNYTINRLAFTTRFKEADIISPIFSTYHWSGVSSSTSTGVGLNISRYTQNMAIDGYSVIHNNGGIKFVESDVSVSYNATSNFKITSNLSSDTYASNKLQPGVINWMLVSSGIEWSSDRGGGLLNYRYAQRTDGGHLHGPHAKIWVSPLSGATVYLQGRGYSNSATSPLYFSPLEYTRYGVGGTYRFGWSGGRVGVTLEYSNVNVDGIKDTAVVYKLDLNQRISRGSRLIFSAGRDYSTLGNYTYDYINAVLKISF
jgi:hypothetical protein